MAKWRLVIMVALFFCFLVSFAVGQSNESSGFVPHWKVGDTWLVKAIYRDQRAKEEVWLAPITWKFEVKSIKDIHRQPCYVLYIFPVDRAIKSQAIIYLSTIDLRVLRVIDVFPSQKGVKSQERDLDPFQPEPLLAEGSMVPYDIPIFPLIRKNIQSADGFAAYVEPAPRKFSKVSKVGGLKFKKSVSQAEKAPDKQHADLFDAYRSLGGEQFQIELFDSKTNETLVQLWQEGAPWSIVSQSPSKVVRLVVPGAKPSQEVPPAGGGNQ